MKAVVVHQNGETSQLIWENVPDITFGKIILEIDELDV